MPRTIWEQNDSRWKDDPRWNNPSYLRGCAEEAHYESQRKAFHIPLYIHPVSTEGEYQLDFRDSQNRNASRRLSALKPDDYGAFCWKDCAIYGNAGLTGADAFALLDEVYREWFPHRADDKDVSDGSFFGKFMQFTLSVARGLERILRFHRVLGEKLRGLEDVGDRELSWPCEARPRETRRVGAYKLREIFLIVFIVVEAGWQAHGVLLMWENEDVAKRFNCMEDGEIKGENCGDAGDLGEACVFRCPLKRAMQIVVSQDPERARNRTEYNEILEETLGGE